MIIEVIASTVQDCRVIAESNAHRIQLVSALEVGGLTPSYGMIRKCLQISGKTPINVMIRPHSQSFVYSKADIECMVEDIIICQDLKVNGIVLGPLLSNNTIDTTNLQILLSKSGNLQVTFHKAFDAVPDLLGSLKTLQNYSQINRILTQGGTQAIANNYKIIQQLIQQKSNKIILLGGGLKFDNIENIYKQFGATCQYHFGTALRDKGRVSFEKITDLLKIVDC